MEDTSNDAADAAVEHFRTDARRARVGEELSDVLLYLLRLADVLGVDLNAAASAKLDRAAERFRPDAVRDIAPDKG